MSTAEQARKRIVQPWQRFVDGTPYPKFCWPSPFIDAFKKQSPSGSMMVVAAGELEQDVAHALHGEIRPEVLIKSLGRATNGINRLSPDESAVFNPGYERIIKSPGRSNVDVLVMTFETSSAEVSMAHFGSRAIDELIPQLGIITTRLAEQTQAA
jgi:hypothetical protein